MKDFDPLVDTRPISYVQKHARVAPEFDHSILVTSPGHWDVGSLMTCEKIELGHDVPSDAVCQWIDDGLTYYLRKRSVPKTELGDGDPEPGIMIRSEFRGIWTLSPNVFCKTDSWIEGVTTDAESIRFVNEKIPSIPTEELIYDWIDHNWYRWFMLSKRVPGTRFYEAWVKLTNNQRLDVAADVAKHAKALAAFTSEYIETVTGQGVEGHHRLQPRDDLPNWKPRIEPRVSGEEHDAAMNRVWSKKYIAYPKSKGPFVLQHRDLIPTNIFVTTPEDPDKKAEVTAIIDWQSLSYFPHYMIATIPRCLWSYGVYDQPDGNDWQWMLSNALYNQGFPLEMRFMKSLTHPAFYCVRHLLLEVENDLQMDPKNKPQEHTKDDAPEDTKNSLPEKTE